MVPDTQPLFVLPLSPSTSPENSPRELSPRDLRIEAFKRKLLLRDQCPTPPDSPRLSHSSPRSTDSSPRTPSTSPRAEESEPKPSGLSRSAESSPRKGEPIPSGRKLDYSPSFRSLAELLKLQEEGNPPEEKK